MESAVEDDKQLFGFVVCHCFDSNVERKCHTSQMKCILLGRGVFNESDLKMTWPEFIFRYLNKKKYV